MTLHKTTPSDDGFRIEGTGDIGIIRRDFVPPVPVGSYVVLVFRVDGYDGDCDGSAMARLARVDLNGETTGWKAAGIGLDYEDILTVDAPSDLVKLVQES